MGLRLGPILAGVGAGAKSLQGDREKKEAKQIMLEDRIRQQEDRSRRIMLEDAMRERQEKLDAASAHSRSLDDLIKENTIEAAKNGPRVTPSQRTYDPARGVVVDEIEGKAIPVQGLPARAPTEAQSAANEGRRLDRTRDLRADYQKDPTVKNAYDVSRVATGIKAALAGDAPMDDLAIIYETVKLFDPASVVREGEIKLLQSANSLPLQLRLIVERWNSGKLLTPGMRAHIAALVDRKVQGGRDAVAPVQSEFGRMARQYDVQSDSSFIAPDPFRGMKSDKRSRLPNQ
jgi:hypothetical protein